MITIRPAEESDAPLMVEWLLQPNVLEGFPLSDLREVEDAVRIWVSYRKFGSCLTALVDGIPCANAVLYLQPYKKLAHQCLFAIIVDEKYRGQGVGRKLLETLMQLAKETFHIDLLHLEVYEGNEIALNLYRKLGFVEYGKQRHFVKADGRYLTKIMMQKRL